MKHEVESDNLIVNQFTFIMSLYKIVQQFEFLTFPATFMESERCLQLLQVVTDKQKSLEMILIHPVCCWETCIKELGNLRNFRQILYPERLSEGKLKESKLNSVCYFFYTVSLIFWSFITIYYTGGGALCGVVGSLNISIQVLIFWSLFGPNRCYKRNIFIPTIS